MKFIVDAHLPMTLARYLRDKGHDVVHTLELPDKNQTDDKEIIRVSTREQRIVISKDSDFYNFFILFGQPQKVLMISTGNIVNKDLLGLFDRNYSQLMELLTANQVVEMSNSQVTVHF